MSCFFQFVFDLFVCVEFVCHCMVKANKLAVAMVTNRDYPRRIAFEVMQDVAKKWEEIHPNWQSTGVDQNISFPHMEKVCKSYEDPRKSDNILKIQNQLDETKDIMIQVGTFCLFLFFFFLLLLFCYIPSEH